MMDGLSKAQLQVSRGTRPLVELLNELRIYFGYEKILVKTPIVESRLRSGLVPVKPLVIAFSHSVISLQMTIYHGYPDHAIEIQIAQSLEQQMSSKALNELETKCNMITHDKQTSAKHMMNAILATIDCSIGLDERSTVEDLTTVIKTEQPDIDDLSGDIPAFYHCRKCRYLLFDSLSFHEHSISKEEVEDSVEGCTSYFLEEAPGFVATDGLDASKINCPKCTARVGAWSWIGTTCSCNVWIAPAFQIAKSKVDRKLY
jgi:dual specificity phosphatase 12